MNRRRPPSAPAPLVLIHGMTSSPRAWRPVLPRLVAEREVHTIALPGHRGGPTLERPDALRSLDYVTAVEAELDRRGIAAADIVGNSLGGWIALRLAERGRARAVVCLAPAGGWLPGSPFDRALAAQFAAAYRFCRGLTSTAAGQKMLRRRPVRRALLHAMVARPELVSDRGYVDTVYDVAGCEAIRSSVYNRAARDLSYIPPLSTPTLIAWSAMDRILVAERYRSRLARLVGAPEVVTLPGVGHVPMSDDPELVASTILAFTS